MKANRALDHQCPNQNEKTLIKEIPKVPQIEPEEVKEKKKKENGNKIENISPKRRSPSTSVKNTTRKILIEKNMKNL